MYNKTPDENDPVLRKIQEFCLAQDVSFQIRLYDFFKEEDRDEIEELPAIQVYTWKHHEETLYPARNPVQKLQVLLNGFRIQEAEWQAKKQIWEERIRYLKSMFRSLKTDSKTSTESSM